MRQFHYFAIVIPLMTLTGCVDGGTGGPDKSNDTGIPSGSNTADDTQGTGARASDPKLPADTASSVSDRGADDEDTRPDSDPASGDADADEDSDRKADSDPAMDKERGTDVVATAEDNGSDTVVPDTDDETLDAGDAADGDDIDLGISHDPVTLLVVFDKSGSMSSYWDGRSRWEAASDALRQAVEATIDRVTVGAVLFPMPSSCEVEEIVGDHQIFFMPGEEFITAWESAAYDNGPDGSTPLYEAFQVADRAIALAEEEGLTEQPLKVFVLTDGEPNCDYDPETITDYPEKWLGKGISTYVFGLPGSSTAVEVLDRIAAAGGTGQHISSDPGDTPEDLRDDVIVTI